MNKKHNIGLFFGSFNPITIGHLIVSISVIENTNLDELWFVVSPENPEKRISGELEDSNHRLAMVKTAIADISIFSACDIEFNMPKPSYTADTLKLLREQNPDVKFSIIAGTDTQIKIGNYWKNHEEILNHHDIIVYPRTISEKDSKFVLTDKTHSVSTYIDNVPNVDISATYIRNNIQNNKSIKYMVPDSVIEYIKIHNLYIK